MTGGGTGARSQSAATAGGRPPPPPRWLGRRTPGRRRFPGRAGAVENHVDGSPIPSASRTSGSALLRHAPTERIDHTKLSGLRSRRRSELADWVRPGWRE